MKKVMFQAAICAAFVCGTQFANGKALLATQIQAAVMGALEELKFTFVPDPSGKVGGPATMKITRETIRHLEQLMNEGKVIVIDNDGKITTERGKGK